MSLPPHSTLIFARVVASFAKILNEVSCFSNKLTLLDTIYEKNARSSVGKWCAAPKVNHKLPLVDALVDEVGRRAKISYLPTKAFGMANLRVCHFL